MRFSHLSGFPAVLLVLCLFVPEGPAQVAETPKEEPSPEPAFAGAEETAKGKQMYDLRCKSCHRSDGKGTLEEMDLTDSTWKHGGTAEDIERVIRDGIKGTGMRAILGDYTEADLKALVGYVLKFSAAAPAPPALPEKPSAPPQAPPEPVKTGP